MIAFLGLIFGIIILMFIGGTFGYYMYKVKESLSKIMDKLNKPIEIKKTGPTQGTYRPHELLKDSTSSVVVPRTPKEIERLEMQKLRDEGYNVD